MGQEVVRCMGTSGPGESEMGDFWSPDPRLDKSPDPKLDKSPDPRLEPGPPILNLHLSKFLELNSPDPRLESGPPILICTCLEGKALTPRVECTCLEGIAPYP